MNADYFKAAADERDRLRALLSECESALTNARFQLTMDSPQLDKLINEVRAALSLTTDS